MLPLLLALALTPQTPAAPAGPAASDGPLATRALDLAVGPEVRVHEQDGPLVALRLSAPVPPELPEGGVELLQELARPAAEAEARRLGARIVFRHEGGRAVLAVTGPLAAFDGLAAIVRRAAGEPELAVASLRAARARAEDRVLARLEQPGDRIRRLLRHGLYGGAPPRGAVATRLEPESIRRLRARLYAPDRLRVVLVGAVPDPVTRSAFADWPAAGPAGLEPLAPVDTVGAEARPQIHREWGGIAFPATGDPVVLEVAAELVRQRLARSPLRFGAVEAWYAPGPALALIGAAAPGDTVVAAAAGISELAVRDSTAIPATDVRRYLRRLIAEAAALAGPEAVAAARTAVRRRLLLDARTAAGKAEVIGAIADGPGPAVSPGAWLARLGAVEAGAVRALLTRVLESPAVTAGR